MNACSMRVPQTRRSFLCTASGALSATAMGLHSSRIRGQGSDWPGTLIDLHQHTHYSGRSDEALLAHQQAMGITMTILLPAGKYYGLAAQCGTNQTVYRLAQLYPDRFAFFANEVPDLPMAMTIRPQLASLAKMAVLTRGELAMA